VVEGKEDTTRQMDLDPEDVEGEDKNEFQKYNG
jgi:hypothetical protein